MEIDLISASEANAILDGHHYLGAKARFAHVCFATLERDAVAIYAPPVAASIDRNIFELARLWQADNQQRPVLQFLAATLRTLKRTAPHCLGVMSYADPAQNHTGGVYVAANFVFAGERRRTDYWVTKSGERISAPQAYRRLRTKSRTKIARKRPSWRLIKGERKLLFVYGLRVSSADMLDRIKSPTTVNLESYKQRFPAKRCAACGSHFVAARADAMTCSVRCRVAKHRRVARPPISTL